ncbi:MAG TPA: DUF302 domain-containing protein [Candidatus Aquabacterium excrementipullorum]|nr:DUF302 domain-containing protein [Candidatus Aquabacterium excrementipullorum]
MRMSRYWMSGCMALVLMAAGQSASVAREADAGDADLERQGWVSLTSRLPLDQTVKQLQRAARAKGMPVVADVAAAASAKQADGSSDTRVLVLGRQDGHTPIFQAADSNQMDLPWRVVLQSLPDGSTRVLFNDPAHIAARIDHADPADGALASLGALPEVVSAALSRPGAKVAQT